MKSIYGDQVTFLTIYIIEAHPNASKSAYNPGWQEKWETPLTVGMSIDIYDSPLFQPRTFKERVHQAKNMIAQSRIAALDLLHPTNLAPVTTPVLVDDMDNRVWATYGYMPNCAYLIGKDGTVKYREQWHSGSPTAPYAWPNMEEAIKQVLTP